jgi:hypothetical protein
MISYLYFQDFVAVFKFSVLGFKIEPSRSFHVSDGDSSSNGGGSINDGLGIGSRNLCLSKVRKLWELC